MLEAVAAARFFFWGFARHQEVEGGAEHRPGVDRPTARNVMC